MSNKDLIARAYRVADTYEGLGATIEEFSDGVKFTTNDLRLLAGRAEAFEAFLQSIEEYGTTLAAVPDANVRRIGTTLAQSAQTLGRNL